MLKCSAASRLLFGGIFLTSGFYARQDSEAYQHYRAGDNPMRRHMHQVRSIDESADQNCVADCVNSERHKNSLSARSGENRFLATEPTIQSEPPNCDASPESDAVQNGAD